MEKKQEKPLSGTDGWRDRHTDVNSLHDSETGSDNPLVTGNRISRWLKSCLIIIAAAVVIATGVGLAVYFILYKPMEEDHDLLMKILPGEESIVDNNLIGGQKELTIEETFLTNDVMVQDGDALHVRLEGGLGDFQGRVLVLIGKTWGSVCSNTWTELEASAVCKSLGYESGEPLGLPGIRTSPVALSGVSCPPGATELEECDFEGLDPVCTYNQQVAVTCKGENHPITPDSFHRGPRAFSGLSCGRRGCRCGRLEPFNRERGLRPRCDSITTTTSTTTVSTTTLGAVALDWHTDIDVDLTTDGLLRVRSILYRRDGRISISRWAFVHAVLNTAFSGFPDFNTHRRVCRKVHDRTTTTSTTTTTTTTTPMTTTLGGILL